MKVKQISIIRFFLFITLGFIFGCAAVQPVPFPEMKTFDSQNDAKVIIYRPNNLMVSAAVTSSVAVFSSLEGTMIDESVVELKNGQFCELNVKPGKVRLLNVLPSILNASAYFKTIDYNISDKQAKWPFGGSMKAEIIAKPGSTHYIQIDPPILNIVDAEVAEKDHANFSKEKKTTGRLTHRLNRTDMAEMFKHKGRVGIFTGSINKAASVYKNFIGGPGILDMAITSIANYKLQKRLQKEFVKPYLNNLFETPFKKAFLSEGMEVMTTAEIEEKGVKQKISNQLKKGLENQENYRILSKELGLDYLISIYVAQFGVEKKYILGFIPGEKPKTGSFCAVAVYDMRKNDFLQFRFVKETEEIKGNWDVPPEYEPIIKGVVSTLKKTSDELYEKIFDHKP